MFIDKNQLPRLGKLGIITRALNSKSILSLTLLNDQDTMAFQDVLNSGSESFEEFVNTTAALLRDGYRSIAPPEWVPDSMKPPPPSPRFPTIISRPQGYLALCRDWVSEHRAVSAAVVAFVGTGGFIVWRRRRADRAKRRARRAKNGARTEVVILAGSPHAPLTKSMSLDLERRGFIVYIPVSSLAEEQVIQAVSRADIRALNVDITSVQPIVFIYAISILLTSSSLPPLKKPSTS